MLALQRHGDVVTRSRRSHEPGGQVLKIEEDKTKTYCSHEVYVQELNCPTKMAFCTGSGQLEH